MRFHDLYIGANSLLRHLAYFQGFKGLFQPQREVQTYCLTSTQCFKQLQFRTSTHQSSITYSLFIAKHLCAIHYSVINVARMFPCVEKAFAPMIF